MKKLRNVFLLVTAIVLLAQPVFAQSFPFSDHEGHKWQNAVEFVYNRGVVQGYPDGTFRPYDNVKRGELMKIIVASKYDEVLYNSYEGDACFDDMDGSEWYAKYVCFGKDRGIVEGYEDNTFKAGNNVNFVEALKITLVGMDEPLTSYGGDAWYDKYYDTADDKGLIPQELEGNYASDFSRAQTAEVIKRIISLDFDIITEPVYTTGGGYEPGAVYLAYLQEGNVLDVYIFADPEMTESYAVGNLTLNFEGNTLISFSSDYGVDGQVDGNSVNINSSHTVYSGEQLHYGTAYFENSNSVSITVE
jgi:hypothetical protein